jgi:hypothetical protein
MSVTAAAFRRPDGLPIVVVTTGVKASQATAPAGNPAPATAKSPFEPIEILTSAFTDGDKSVEWQRQRLSAALRDGIAGQLRYESVSTLSVKPGTYEVRVAARHAQEGYVGSVHAYVDVPDFDAEPVTLSGVVLLDRRAPTISPPEALAGVLDMPPTTRREFRFADDIAALVRVYQRAREQPSPVRVSFRVLDAALKEVIKVESVLASTEFATTGSADARYPIPLRTLKPGAYVLRIEGPAGRPADQKDVRFIVE